MLFNKKGQGLPLNTIIIAIIVIVVLVIIILIFTGQLGTFAQTANRDQACRDLQGQCVTIEFCKSVLGDSHTNCVASAMCDNPALACMREVGATS